MTQTNRTAHQIRLDGKKSATAAIQEATRAHKNGRGRKGKPRKDSDGANLAPKAAAWLEKNMKKEPAWSQGTAAEEGQEHDLNAKGQAALDNGGRILTDRNGQRRVIDAKGRTAQVLRSANRTEEGTFAPDAEVGEQDDDANLEIAREILGDFFGAHEPSGPQIKGFWMGYKASAEHRGWFIPDISPDDL